MTCIEKTVWCRTSFIGFHRWPGAPTQAMHLRYPHRHVFNVEVHVLVKHNDREIEFQLLKSLVDDIIRTDMDLRKLQPDTFIPSAVGDYASLSCEMIAEIICKHLVSRGFLKPHKVTVDEDGENGATLYYTESTERS